MRNWYDGGCDCNNPDPVIGVIVGGKKFPFGTVKQSDYNADQKEVNDRLTVLDNRINVNKQLTDTEINAIKQKYDTRLAVLEANTQVLSDKVDKADSDIRTNAVKTSNIEVSVAALGNQLSNTTKQLTESVELVSSDINTVRKETASVQESLIGFEKNTDVAIALLNKRVEVLEGGQVIEILSFTATPSLCEKGSTENIVLSWVINGNPKNITINGELFTGQGSEMTVKNVTADTRFTLTATSEKGTSVSRSVDVSFVNHIFWGTTSSSQINEGVVKGLDNTALTDVRTRTFRESPNNEYIVYAYPKRLGTSTFVSGGYEGGFNNPITVAMDNHSGLEEDYYVYRSENRLTVPVEISVL